MEHYKDKATCFNDDIQGTASVVLAGLFSSLSLAGKNQLADHTYLFLGAGEAGIGIADLISMAIVSETGCTMEKARERCWFVDSKGLITNARLSGKIEHHKIPYAHSFSLIGVQDGTAAPNSLFEAVKLVKPTALVGVSGQGSTFTEAIVKDLLNYSAHPVIMALSNPTNLAECTARDAYTWSNGQCIYASGSPFDPVTLEDGRHFVPGQGNNAYIFPGVGLGALVANASKVTDGDFLIAAKTLASLVTKERKDVGCAYPDLKDIRTVSKHIAAAVAKHMHDTGRAHVEGADSIDWEQRSQEMMYVPSYH